MERVRKRIHLDEVKGSRWAGHPLTIAVLDSGICTHPDLLGKCMVFKDFVNQEKLPYDDYGHGTHVCGIISGSGESSQGRYRGIIASARLVVGKVLNHRGEGSADVMIQALEWIYKIRKIYDVRLLNISIGIDNLKDEQKTKRIQKLLENLWDSGVIVVCAAGNKGPKDGSISDLGGSNKLLTIGCCDDGLIDDGKHSCEQYSGRGEKDAKVRKPDLVAPGTGIISCCHEFYRENGVYRKLYVAKSGTSMAAPIVTGCAALLLQNEPYLSNEKVKERLHYTAEDLGKPWNQQGWGMIHAKNMMEIL